MAKKLRSESVAQENRTRKLQLEVKLREAEAKKAHEKGREATAAARKEAEAARLRAKEQARLVEEGKEAQSRLRLKFAAKLCGELLAYMGGHRCGVTTAWPELEASLLRRLGERRVGRCGHCPSFGRHLLRALRK